MTLPLKIKHILFIWRNLDEKTKGVHKDGGGAVKHNVS